MSICCKSHCCVLHGCKYGNDDCPVYHRIVIQDYPCEDCHWENLDTVSQVLNKMARIPDSHLDKVLTVFDEVGIKYYMSKQRKYSVVHLQHDNPDRDFELKFDSGAYTC